MRFVVLLMLFLSGLNAAGQSIRGEITDGETKLPVNNVTVENIHRKTGTITDHGGVFALNVESGELVEFRKIGYKTVRVRIPGSIPPYFKIIMNKGAIELPEFELNSYARAKDYKTDSIRYRELYKNILDFPKMSSLEMMRSPFSAMSKSNRQKWAFQENYTMFQQLKYVDYVFNEKLVSNVTGLKGDSLQNYMQRYRPSYEQLRSMKEYNFFLYIKQSASRFRNSFNRPRNSG